MKLRHWLSAACILMTTLASPASFGADHEDGPKVTDFPWADILDLYTFPAPDGKNLVLIMTLYSNAGDDAGFSSVVDYRFRIRPADVAVEGAGRQRQFKVTAKAVEDVIECSFQGVGRSQIGTCTLNADSCGNDCVKSASQVDRIVPAGTDGMRMFAGLVHDPFFSDVFRARKKRPRDKDLNWIRPALNPFKKRNATAIVVEVPIGKLRSGPGVLAVAGETVKGEQ